MKTKFKKGDLVVVYWIDITSNDGWMPVQTVEDFTPFNMVSVGWFVNNNDCVVRLASTVCQNDGTSNVLAIPEAVISKIVLAKYERMK